MQQKEEDMDTQDNNMAGDSSNDRYVTLAANIVTAFVGSPNNRVDPATIPDLIKNMHTTLVGLGSPVAAEPAKQEPAVSIRSSIKPDYIVCLEDGAKLKMLKRYLRQKFGMTPDEYRAKWGLPKDYPMVAPNYAEARRDLAKKIGLGTLRTRSTRGGKAAEAETGGENAKAAEAPKPRQRKKADTAKTGDAPKRRGRPSNKAKAEAAAAANA